MLLQLSTNIKEFLRERERKLYITSKFKDNSFKIQSLAFLKPLFTFGENFCSLWNVNCV